MRWTNRNFDSIVALVVHMNEHLTPEQAKLAKIVTGLPRVAPYEGYGFGGSYHLIYPEDP